MMWKTTATYEPIRSSEKLNDLEEEQITGRHTLQLPKSPEWALRISAALNVVLVVLMVIIAMQSFPDTTMLNPELRATWGYSPLHDLVNLELSVATVNGSLFPGKSTSISRQMPNPESDELWEEWELTRIFPISREQVERMGKDPETAVKLEDHLWGLGDDAYAAQFDVYHQLHCLNSLRQIAYGTYYNRSMVDPSPPKSTMKDIHLNHCVDILMQAIQCSGNVNLITMHWVETQSYPFPDMSINRKCINFEKLTDWRLHNTIDMDKWVEVMSKPAGVKEKLMVDEFYTLKDLPNPHKGDASMDGTV